MNYLTIAAATNSFGNIYFIILIAGMLVFMFFSSRSQKKKEQTRQKELDSLVSGDEIVTIGGFYATVVSYNDNDRTFVIKLKPDGTKVVVRRDAVAFKLTKEEAI